MLSFALPYRTGVPALIAVWLAASACGEVSHHLPVSTDGDAAADGDGAEAADEADGADEAPGESDAAEPELAADEEAAEPEPEADAEPPADDDAEDAADDDAEQAPEDEAESEAGEAEAEPSAEDEEGEAEREREREPEPEPEPEPDLDDYPWLGSVACGTPRPEWAAPPPDLPAYSGGECPALRRGYNDFTSHGTARRFLLVAPREPLEGEVYPVLFAWYWLKASANSFLEHGELQDAVDQQRFLAVVPVSKGDISIFGALDLPWPFTTFESQARFDEEFGFFDDMLACVAAQFAVDRDCVSTVGVSAGAMFSVQLAAARSEYFSSLLSLSGGVKGTSPVNSFMRPWTPAAHKLPAVVLWGGPSDSCVLLNFEDGSHALEAALAADGHFFLECIHNCRHGEPPLDPAPGTSRYAALWDFAFKHPRWLPPGLSPYLVNGYPADLLPWCGIGAASAVPREGACAEPGCPLR